MKPSLKSALTLSLALVAGRLCCAQDPPQHRSWTASSQQDSPTETWNPIRTHQSHTEENGRVLDRTVVECMGPDGRYVPYMETEKESVQVNSTTIRSVERTFAQGAEGEKILIQERREEALSQPGGAVSIIRTVSNPDVNGTLQIVQREFIDSKYASADTRETTSIVLTPDPNTGLAPVLQTHEVERQQMNGTTDVRRNTWLSDGAGHWQLKEVQEGILQENGTHRIHEESVLRPDPDGKLDLAERTVRTQTKMAEGQESDLSETYSTTVPGVAGENNLQMTRRESAIRRTSASRSSLTRQIESVTPGSTRSSLHISESAIDIVRSNGNGSANRTKTIYSVDANGQLRQVWVDLGDTDNPSVINFNAQSPR